LLDILLADDNPKRPVAPRARRTDPVADIAAVVVMRCPVV
jgi:hypothetical protein